MPLFEAPSNETEETRESGSLFTKRNIMIAGGGVVAGLAIAALIDASTGPAPSPISGALRGPEIKARTAATRDFANADANRALAERCRLAAVNALQNGDEAKGRAALDKADAAGARADEAQARVDAFLAQVAEDRRQAALAQAGVMIGEVVSVEPLTGTDAEEQQAAAAEQEAEALAQAALGLGLSPDELRQEIEAHEASIAADAVEQIEEKYAVLIKTLQDQILQQEVRYDNLVSSTVANAVHHELERDSAQLLRERNKLKKENADLERRLTSALESLDGYVNAEEAAEAEAATGAQISISAAGKGRPTPRRPKKGNAARKAAPAAAPADAVLTTEQAEMLIAAMTADAEAPEIVV